MKTDTSLNNSVIENEIDLADKIGFLKKAVKEVTTKMNMMDMSQLARSAYIPENLAAMQHNDKLREMLTI